MVFCRMVDFSISGPCSSSLPAFIPLWFLIRTMGSFRILLHCFQLLIWDKLSVLAFCRVVNLSVAANSRHSPLALNIKKALCLGLFIWNGRFLYSRPLIYLPLTLDKDKLSPFLKAPSLGF